MKNAFQLAARERRRAEKKAARKDTKKSGVRLRDGSQAKKK